MKIQPLPASEWAERAIAALLFIAVGTLIIVVFSPLRPLLSHVSDYVGRIVLVAVLLAAVLLLRRSQSQRYSKYAPLVVGLLIMAGAVSLDYVFGSYLLESVGVADNTPAGFALVKLNECVIIVGAVVVLTRLSGGSLGSIYLQKGNLKLGLIIGLVAFGVAALGSLPMATLMFQAGNLTLARVIPWLPWVLIFVIANATQEELLVRGLFLRKLEPFYGRLLSNCLIAFVFTGLHRGVTYPSDQYLFVVFLVVLALAWGYVMQKTDNLWSSALFHAGTDIPVILGIFANFS